MPIAASRNAATANAPSTRSCTTRGAVSSDDHLFERAHVGNRQLRIGLPDDRAHRRHQRRRRHRRPDDQVLRRVEPATAIALLECRQVDLRLVVVSLESAEADVADHADDGPDRAHEPERSPDRILIGILLARERLADDGDRRRVQRIRFRDIASLQDRNANRLEVTRRDVSQRRALHVRRRSEAAKVRRIGRGRQDLPHAAAHRERREADVGGALDAGQARVLARCTCR